MKITLRDNNGIVLHTAKKYCKEDIEVGLQTQEITVNPTKEVQTKEGLFNKVTVNPIESEELNITPQKIPQEFNGLFNKVNVEAVEINLQDKIIEPTKSVQEVMADANYDGMRKITVSAIPDEFIVPTDNIAIIENGTYNVTDFETATVNVPTPKPNLGTKEVTVNGEYSASEDNLDGYSKVSVNIPVPEPNVATKTITENGTYSASDEGLDGYSSVEVNVASSGGGSAEPLVEKDVNFYTPYGDLVASYTIEEANNLTELPEAPELPRLTFEEWNYDLADIQATTTPLDVGGTYTTTSGASEFDFDVNSKSGMTVTFVSLTGMTSVDWGDGTIDKNLTHTYSTPGKYTVCVYGLTRLAQYLLTSNASSWNYNLVEVRLANMQILYSNCFYRCRALRYITIPKSMNIYHTASQFYYCHDLKYFVFPKVATGIDAAYMFAYCYNLKGISMPIKLTGTSDYAFNYCYSLKKMVFSKNATTIKNMFGSCYGLEKLVFGNITSFPTLGENTALIEIDLTNCTSVPSLSSSAFNSINRTCKIKVPANLYNNFRTSSNWSAYADFFVAV